MAEKEVKICKQCGKEIDKEQFLSTRTSKYGKEGPWKILKYCSTNCKQLSDKSKLKYKLKNTFHDITVDELNNQINGRINLVHCTQGENPDIETDSSNYEIEVYCNHTKWSRKYDKRRNGSKKHILIIVPDKRLKEFFDEIRFYEPKDQKV